MKTGKCAMIHLSGVRMATVADAYDEMVESGVLTATFYGGSVKSFDDFMGYVFAPANHFWFLFYEGALSGFSWVNGLEGKAARGHFCMFPRVYGKKSITLGRFVAANLVRHKDSDGKSLLDVVVGVTPKRNVVAIRWIKRIGAVVRGEIPYGVWMADTQQSEPAILSAITRESTEDAWASA